MKKLLFIALPAIVLIGVACWLVVTAQKPPVLPPPITLPDGSSAQIIGVTFGTNHVVGTKMARFSNRLPVMFQEVLRVVFGPRAVPVQSRTTPTPELIVWLDRQTNRAGVAPPTGGYCEAYLADGSNFTSGADANINSFLTFSMVEPLQFAVLPRRDPVLHLNIYSHDTQGGVHFYTNLTFANPAYQQSSPYPQWQPEPLPVVKRVGDVEATLSRLEAGHSSHTSVMWNADGTSEEYDNTNYVDGRNQTLVKLKLRPLVDTNEVWQVANEEVSDATGNSAHNTSMSWGGNDPTFSFTPSLWPNEPAWKLKLEIKRTAGFKPGEMFTFKNVPLGQLDRTNIIAWSTNFGGVTVTLQNIYRKKPLTNNSWSSSQISNVHFTLAKLPAGTQLDLLSMVFDTGKTNHTESWSSGDTERDYGFREIPLEAQTADFTFAVQQSRSVEFVVKPELPKPKVTKKQTKAKKRPAAAPQTVNQ